MIIAYRYTLYIKARNCFIIMAQKIVKIYFLIMQKKELPTENTEDTEINETFNETSNERTFDFRLPDF